MPVRAARICGCGHRVASGVLCPCEERRSKERKARHDAKRPNAQARGYDAEWQEEAKAFLRAPGNERCACGAPSTVVMHVISIRRRPDLRMVKSNWRPGCHRCNAREAARDKAEATGGGSRLAAGANDRRGVNHARPHKFGFPGDFE